MRILSAPFLTILAFICGACVMFLIVREGNRNLSSEVRALDSVNTALEARIKERNVLTDSLWTKAVDTLLSVRGTTYKTTKIYEEHIHYENGIKNGPVDSVFVATMDSIRARYSRGRFVVR
jgi:hypothetical protein